MSTKADSGGAKRTYLRVADELRASIESGAIALGDQLPTHAELVTQFAVSRATIQKALRALQDEHYVQSVQGKGVFARDWNAPESEPGSGRRAPEAGEQADPAPADLNGAIAWSFGARHVTIDASCLTSESLNAAIVPQAGRIMLGELRPESVHVRLLLPNALAVRAIARNVADPADTRPAERLLGLIGTHTGALRNLLADLGERGHIESVRVEARTHAMPPQFKIYQLNGERGLKAYYVMGTRSVQFDDETVEISDVRGVGARLFRIGGAELAESATWFDSWWSAAEPQAPQ
ncbi:winged helix-turn-helix domain-containing protein [Streptomyces sp. NBC_01198]|uniref:winged helix-turn-helix domain-containing protein n=1 Tax=Streptomyces sp. NBC_01198 TaxID=2903769 RepID=UPI002E0E9C3F|nr:winged helix-turn-helix domain-containing protein [Streptomyces sp. NBC_01198]